MERIFKIHSPRTSVVATLTYRNDTLVGCYFETLPAQETEAVEEISPKHFNWVIGWFFDLELMLRKVKDLGYTCVEADEQVPTFEQFWEMYAKKDGKKEARDKWVKLKPHEHLRAYKYIGIYDAEVRRNNVAKLYAKTYLFRKIWEV